MVTKPDSRLRGLGSTPHRGPWVVLLGKRFNSRIASSPFPPPLPHLPHLPPTNINCYQQTVKETRKHEKMLRRRGGGGGGGYRLNEVTSRPGEVAVLLSRHFMWQKQVKAPGAMAGDVVAKWLTSWTPDQKLDVLGLVNCVLRQDILFSHCQSSLTSWMR